MKSILLICFLLLTINVNSQVPNGIPYHGVFRDGQLTISSERRLIIIQTIYKENLEIYKEEHEDVKSPNGHFDVTIGTGKVIYGSFKNIDWQNGMFFLKTELRIVPIPLIHDLGTIQLITVPFAFQALNSTPWVNSGNSITNSHENVILNGKLGINTTKTSGDHKLYVDGSILCTELKVETVDNWPDYVFKKGYKLLSLDSLEQYIKLNKKLPNMPSSNHVSKNGYNLSEINKLLLQSIEELNLRILELNKQIKAIQK